MAWIQGVLFGVVLAWGTANAQSVPRLKNVVWIWLENTPHATLIAQKYLRQVWQTNPSVVFTQYYPVSKVTQANVVAMIAGSEHGIQTNEIVRLSQASMIDLLESRNLSWRVYVEDYPGSCYQGAGTGNYRRYRTPFVSLTRVQSDRYLCSKIVSFRNLEEDVQFSQMPRFSVVIPSVISSGLYNTAASVENTIRKILDPILAKPQALTETTIVLSTTNNTDPRRPEMFLMLLGQGLKSPAQAFTQPVDHYRLLRTLQEGLRLGHLNQRDAQAEPLTGFWGE